MKVKIVKCSSSIYWYNECVGLILEVCDSVYDTADYDVLGTDLHRILKTDCEIVKEDKPVEKLKKDRLTVRDQFAMSAMNAIISKSERKLLTGTNHEAYCRPIALGAYGYADAMVKARGSND